MYLLILFLLLIINSSCLIDNDNYVLYAEDIGGYPVLSKEGHLYLVGVNITKIDLKTKTPLKEIEIFNDASSTSKISSFQKGVLSNTEDLLIAFTGTNSGPNCARIIVLTAKDMRMRADDCFKITSDNIFGPKVLSVKAVPEEVAGGRDLFFAVGHHIDYVNGDDTAFVMEFEVMGDYSVEVLRYQALNSDYRTSGTTKGFVDINFDKDASNILVSGIIRDSSQEYITLLSASRETLSINWTKHIKLKTTSTLNPSSKETKSTYNAQKDKLIICTRFNNFNITDYSNKDLIYITSINPSTGTLDWEVQFSDYATNSINDFDIVIHPDFNQLLFMNSNGAKTYYHVQAINLENGQFLGNVQFDIQFHYSLRGVAVFPKGGVFETEDYVFSGEGGYVFKVNSKKRNMVDDHDGSVLHPLEGIHYDNYSLPMTTPTDFEIADFGVPNDFLIEKNGYEMTELEYHYQEVPLPTLQVVSKPAIGLNTTEDCPNPPTQDCQSPSTKVVPNTGKFRISSPFSSTGSSNLSLNFSLFDFSDVTTAISNSFYSLKKEKDDYMVELKGLQDGSYLAKTTLSAGLYNTYSEFTLILRCISNCESCSSSKICDACSPGFTLNYKQQCVTKDEEIIDPSILQPFIFMLFFTLLTLSFIQNKVSPNLWTFLNSLQILRTILLLKANIPLSTREIIKSGSSLGTLNFGLYDLIRPEIGKSEAIVRAMDGDELLGQYFRQYGIKTFRFIDFTLEMAVDVLVVFLLASLVVIGLCYLYLRLKDRSTVGLFEKAKSFYFLNGFIRMYLEILTNAILYLFINLRYAKFTGASDAFSYIFLAIFSLCAITFTLFLFSYSHTTEIYKWSSKITELLVDSKRSRNGVLTYHLIFILRRVAIAINIITLGALGSNVHISIHFGIQATVVAFMMFYPLFEDRFQKGSNLLMEVVVLGIFGTVFVFHNEDLANRGLEIVVLVALLSSLLTLTIITIIKGIQDMKGIDYNAEDERNRDLSSSAHSDRKIPDLKLDQEKGLHNYNKNKVVPQNSIGIAEETKSPISTSLPPLQTPIPPETTPALKNPKNEISSLHKDIFQKADSHPSKLPKLAFKTGENLPFEVHAERIKAFDSTMMESKKPNSHISESGEDLDSLGGRKENNSPSSSAEESKSSSEPPSSPEGKPFSQMERQMTTGNLRGSEVENKNREKDMTLDNLNGGSRIEERDVSAIFKK